LRDLEEKHSVVAQENAQCCGNRSESRHGCLSRCSVYCSERARELSVASGLRRRP
jgi:hypothetical protein